MENDLTIKNAGVHSTQEIQQKHLDLEKNKDKLINYIRENVIGSHTNT